jgi:hypothetical protein
LKRLFFVSFLILISPSRSSIPLFFSCCTIQKTDIQMDNVVPVEEVAHTPLIFA